MKKIYFGTNLKMYKGIQDTVSYLKELNTLTYDLDRGLITLFVIPSYTALEHACASVDQNYIHLGAQNMCWEDQGQFTGEISPLMLEELGLHIIELGHSERRHIFNETDQILNLKVKSALSHQFTALLCVGETGEEKALEISDEVLKTQLKSGLHGLSPQDAEHIWIAYEPVWAIGVNGLPASSSYAEEKHHLIRSTLIDIFGENGRHIPILYGGSVNPDNANELIIQPHIDGLFVGRSAWNASSFNSLIRRAISAYLSHC